MCVCARECVCDVFICKAVMSECALSACGTPFSNVGSVEVCVLITSECFVFLVLFDYPFMF